MTSNTYSDAGSFVHDDEDCKSSSRYKTENSCVELKFLKKKRNIGRKFDRKWLKPCFIIWGIIIGTSIFTAVIYNTLQGGNKTANEIPYTQGLVIVDGNSLWIYDTKVTKPILLERAHNNHILIDVPDCSAVFLHEGSTSTIINVLNNQTSICYSQEWNIHVFAVDYVTKKLYIVDKSLGILIIRDMQSEYYGLALSDLIQPHDIALDTSEGLLFISQKDHSLLRSNMDGKKVKIIKNKNTSRISSIAIVQKNKRIFWSNDYENIITADYEGNHIASIHIISEKIISMTFIDNHLFFLLHTVTGATNASLSSCTVHEQKCQNYKHYPISLTNPSIIKSFSNFHTDTKNPCNENNGNCMHMCLLASNGKSSCACQLGWQLHDSMTDCVQVSSSMIYIENNKFIRLKVIESIQDGAFVDVELPMLIEAKDLSKKDMLDFDYDIEEKTVYIADDKEISKKVIGKYGKQISIYKINKDNEYIKDLAIDWISKNLYFSVQIINTNGNTGFIRLINEKSNVTNFLNIFHCLNTTYSLIVQPHKGYLYFISFYDEFDIRRVFLNGTGLVNIRFIRFYNQWKLLAFDYHIKETMIYWVESLYPPHVCYADLNLSTIHCGSVNVEFPSSLYVFKEYLYISNATSIYRVNKNDFSNLIKIGPDIKNNSEIKISSVKIFSPAVQTKDFDNKCEENNGGCQKFCFPRPELSCINN